MRKTLALVVALVLMIAACGDALGTDDAEGAASIEVTTQDDTLAGQDEGTATPTEEAAGPAATDATEGTQDASSADAGEVIDVRTDHPVEAVPGRWAVLDAGFVEWDLTSDGLVLVEVTAQDGWSSSIDEEDRDEIEVDFRRDGDEVDIEVELDGGRVEVDIRFEREPAEGGVFELGQAGSVEFTAEGGRLELVDVVVADGWERRIDDESADEIEFHLGSGAERWDVEIDTDDGTVTLEIDYQVRSSVGR